MSNPVIFTSRRLVVALSVVAIAVAVGACGSSASNSSSAAGGASATTAGATTARLNLAKCFRAHGINVSDSGSSTATATAGAGGGGGIFRALRNYPRADIQDAMTACKQYLAAAFPAANLSAAQRAQRTAQLVKYATCMRSHNVNIPDPTTTGTGPAGGGFGFGAGGGGGGGANFRSLLNTPAFKKANTACASLRPSFGRFGGGGGGAGAPGA
ncbi:MAG: hypothetical protein ACLP22_22740 [Solirubrobacteraceae bacterium]